MATVSLATTRKPRQSDAALLVVALLCGALFFTSLHRLWPLVPGNLHVPPEQLKATASAFLATQNIDVRGYAASTAFDVDEPKMEALERRFSTATVRSLMEQGLPLAFHVVNYKKPGEFTVNSVNLSPDGKRVLGWIQILEEDAPGARIPVEQARTLARAHIINALTLAIGDWKEIGVSSRDAVARRNHLFIFQRTQTVEQTSVRQRLMVTVSGDRVTMVSRFVELASSDTRAVRSADAPRQALGMVGLILLSGAMLGAIAVFLLRLRDGSARLRQAAILSAVVFLCTMGAALLQTSRAFADWEPLWPRWVSLLQFAVFEAQKEIWTLPVLLALVSAGDALDRERSGQKGETLWKLTRGKWADADVAASSGRGFLVGLICGGVMAASVWVLVNFAGGKVALQPRAFFFYAVNSPLPGISTLLYSLHVALLEELGYRYFSGLWLDKVTRNRVVAIALPALVYGLTHTTLGFLPPAEPFWGRAFVMTLVGAVWGWAFFKYDALTVITSHLTADLFILNWPRLASGDPMIMLSAICTVAAPLSPLLVRAVWLATRRPAPKHTPPLTGVQEEP